MPDKFEFQGWKNDYAVYKGVNGEITLADKETVLNNSANVTHFRDAANSKKELDKNMLREYQIQTMRTGEPNRLRVNSNDIK